MGPTVKRSPFHCSTPSMLCTCALMLCKDFAFRQIRNLQNCQIVQDYKSQATMPVFFCFHLVWVKLVQTFGRARRKHYIPAAIQMGLLALAPGRKPAGSSHLLMTKWNIIAQRNVWIVNLPCSYTQSPVCIHEQHTQTHTLSRPHSLAERFELQYMRLQSFLNPLTYCNINFIRFTLTWTLSLNLSLNHTLNY